MKITGITQSIMHKSAGLSKLTIKRGKYKGQDITIFKEFYKNKPEIKVTFIKDKGYRLCYLSGNKITRKIDRFI